MSARVVVGARGAAGPRHYSACAALCGLVAIACGPAPAERRSELQPATTSGATAAGSMASSRAPESAPTAAPSDAATRRGLAEREAAARAVAGRRPRAWGPDLDGVLTRLEGDQPRLALTLDACGGSGGNGYDAELIDYLRAEQVPATLFLTTRWVLANPTVAKELAGDALFELEDHGDEHRPCSVSGRSAFGLRGTRSVDEALDEVLGGATVIEALSGRAARFYRPGTNYFDDVCVDLVSALGLTPVGFTVAGDGGTGFTRAQVKKALLTAKPGAIVLLHMNQPSRSTAEGVMDALPTLKERGTTFVRLDQAVGPRHRP